jgi:hypothetical protein
VADQLAAGVAVTDDHVEHAGRRNSAAISASITVVTGVVSDGLSTTVLPAAIGRCELPDGHHQRIVPGRDLRADADRLAPDVGLEPFMYCPAERPSSSRAAPAKKRIWSMAGGSSSLRVRPSGLPVFCDSAATSSSVAGLDRVGEPQQRQLPLARRGVAPLLERGGGGLHRPVDVGLAGHRCRRRRPRRSPGR